MSRLVILDSGPLGLLSNPRESRESEECSHWLLSIEKTGVTVAVPEIADYEIRRELIRAGRLRGLWRLDALCGQLTFLSITPAVWKRAAQVWAEARWSGKQTAADHVLDADVLLASLALEQEGAYSEVTVATYNSRHLSRFVDARHWSEIH